METYLSEIIRALPKNCLFDKGKVGCGGTSLAIESKDAYVICVPFISLVENKLSQYPNKRRTEPILGVTGETRVREIKEYLEEVEIPKIIVTYDSLGKVTNQINSSQFKLLVDEYHLLFNQYSFRSDAVKIVLDNYKKYKEFCFMTATPLEKDFVLDELKDLPLVKQEWSDTIITDVQTIKCKNVKASTIKLVKCFLNGQIKGNAYLFVNSVDFIKQIVTYLKLDESTTRVIYSKNNKTDMPILNSSVNTQPKKINFLTSTVFEGSDIYDPDGRIFIISDPSKCQTLLDISTSIQQIAGRIRDSKYINSITHLYGQTRYSELSYEDFKAESNKTEQSTLKLVKQMNEAGDELRELLFTKTDISDKYIKRVKEGLKFEFDPNLVKVDLYNYKICSGTYSVRVNLGEEYFKNGFRVNTAEDNAIKIDFNDTSEPTFKEIVQQVKEELSKPRQSNPLYDQAITKYPFLKDAIDLLGFEKLATLQYNQKKIKDELIKRSDKTINNKISFKAKSRIKPGFWYSKAELKKTFQSIYKDLEIDQAGKAIDVLTFYNAKESKKRIDGDLKDGYTILSNKYFYDL